MARKLAALFDGTWNTPRDRTNVTRMTESILSTGREDGDQPCYYDTGVGINKNWIDQMTGKLFGRGISTNILQGYEWLSRKHAPGDDIFLFGFSRGAYTARSLAGLIRKCGLLHNPSKAELKEAYALYRDKDAHPDGGKAVSFRKAHSRETRIRFIGVWDTVGSLGIPASGVIFGRDYFRWHDTELSKIVDYAYHAMAIDEKRKDFMVTVWTKTKPQNLEVEQRWFIGSHANVGGGYTQDPLPNIPLKWMQEKAQAAGLRLKETAAVGPLDYRAPVTDSFSRFISGFYRFFTKKEDRPFGTGVKEAVDETALRRRRETDDYDPPTLAGVRG